MYRRGLLGLAVAGATATVLPSPASAKSSHAELGEVVTRYFADRAQRVTAVRPSTLRLSRLPLGADFIRSYRQDADRLDDVRAALNALHGGYVRSSTSIRVDDVAVAYSSATLRVRERTELLFADRSADVDSTAYHADHEVELNRSGLGWIITSSVYLPVDVVSTPVTQFWQGATTFAAHTSSQLNSLTRVSDTKHLSRIGERDMTSAGYDYQAMVNYARAWAFGRNPDYPTDYASDCTNFVSQTMEAGGWQTVGSFPWSDRTDNNNWWHDSHTWNTSYTWGAGQNLHWFGLNSGRTYVMGNPWDMGSGDILMYDQDLDWEIDHSQVCTGRNSAGPLMTNHDTDYRDRPLGEISVYPTSRTWAHRT